MRTVALLAALHAAALVLVAAQPSPAQPSSAQPIPADVFVCVEWAGHPHGYDAPIYYWNSVHQAYIWHGADCSMFPNGEALNCDASRIMGTDGNDAIAYSALQGRTDLDDRKRMAFFKSCRLTVNTLEKVAGAWVFRQNGVTQTSAGTCTETNAGNCTGKFTSARPINITAGVEACLSSGRGARNYRGYFASIKEKLIDGVNPVLNMPAKFKAMVDGGVKCDAKDKLPSFTDKAAIYGVMSWNKSNAIQLLQQVMPKPECLITFPSTEVDSLVVGGGTNRTCMQNFTGLGRRLNGAAAGSAIGLLGVSESTMPMAVSASSEVGLSAWVLAALAVALVCGGSM